MATYSPREPNTGRPSILRDGAKTPCLLRRPYGPPQGERIRVTIYIDDNVLEAFRDRADASGRGYQTMINDALRTYLGKASPPIDEDTLRRVIREELNKVG